LAGRDRWASPDEAVRACQDAVRERAHQRYGARDIHFRNLDADDNPGRNDTIMGSFDVRRGNNSNTYRFSCAVDMANAKVRAVDISENRGVGTADRWGDRDNGTSACRRAAEQRIQRDGYRNVQFDWLNADNRRSDRIAGTAAAQRGNNGRAYDFDIQCSLNLDNGSVRSVQVKRR
jgi:hypothetical protein